MTTPTTSSPIEPQNQNADLASSISTAAAKAPYETPRLTTYGRLTHLTLQAVSGGNGGGGDGGGL